MRRSGLWFVLRLLVVIAIGALVGSVTGRVPSGPFPWLVVIASVSDALVARLAADLAAHTPLARRALVALVGASLIVSLLLGAVDMVLVRARPMVSGDIHNIILIVIPSVLAALIVGLLLGSLLAASRPLVAWAIGLLALPIVALEGAFVMLGSGVMAALTFTPCPPHGYCLDLGPWSALQNSWPFGLAVSAWVGGIIWLALGASAMLHPRGTGAGSL